MSESIEEANLNPSALSSVEASRGIKIEDRTHGFFFSLKRFF